MTLSDSPRKFLETGYERPVLTRVGQKTNSHNVEILYVMSPYWLGFCKWGIYVAVIRSTVGTGIFHWNNPSGRTMALGSTHPVTKMSTRCISWWCKGGRCLRLISLPTSWNLPVSTSWNPQGLPRPVLGLLYVYMFVIGCWFCCFRHFVSICGQPCRASISVPLASPHCLLWHLV